MTILHKAAAPLLALVLLSGCSKGVAAPQESSPASEAAAPAEVPLGMLPRVVIPRHYQLDFVIDPARDRFSGHTEIDVNVTKPLTWFYLDGLDLNVKSVAARLAGGKLVPATYKQVDKSGVAMLTFASELPAGPAALVFDYDAPFDQSLSGLYKVVDAGDAYAFTQFEDIDARRAFPSFDEPGFKTPFDITITAPTTDKVVANTPVTNDTGAGNGMMKWTFQQTKPLPTYLVAMAVGPLDIVNAGEVPPNKYRDHPLPLRGIAARGMGPKLKYALSLTPAIVTALENYYGVGYPYPKLDTLAVPDFAAGAMENAGAITYREQLLLMDANAPLDQKRSSLVVQAHEIAHQWFGDLVTPTWWDNIWLNESFATWMEYKISKTVRPDEEFSRATLASALNVMRLDELPSARQIHNPVNNPDDIDNAFDDITYSKGGAVLSMFESYVGPQDWQRGINAYLKKYAFGNANAQDFISTIAETTNHPEIVQAFDDFIDQPHIPLLKTEPKCSAGEATAEIAESMYKPIGVDMPDRTWRVPACVSAEGRGHSCKLVVPPAATAPLGKNCPSFVFGNVDGAGYYRFAMEEPQWQAAIRAGVTLSPADQYTLFNNVTAALRAGQATASDFFNVIGVLAPHATWDLVGNIHDTVHEMRAGGNIPTPDAPKLQAFLRAKFAPRLKEVGIAAKKTDTVATALLRQRLVELLVDEGRDPALMAQLTKAANTYLASGEKNLGGIPPELLREAMRAGVISGGPAFADRVIAALKTSKDEFFIQSAIYAVAGSDDAATLNKLLALALTPTIRTGDMRYVQAYYAAESAARPALWSWFKTNFAAIEHRISARGMGYAPTIQSYACDAATKADLDAFFDPKLGELEGAPRVLRQTNERIDRCMAFNAAKGAELTAALNGAK
jgi:alanyl aminopeptidase